MMPLVWGFLEHPRAWDPQESIVEAEDILNMQKPAGPLQLWYKTRGIMGSSIARGHPEFPDRSLELPLQNALH